MNREQGLLVLVAVLIGWMFLECPTKAQPYFHNPDGGVSKWKSDAGWKSGDQDRMKQYPKSEDNP